MSIINEALKKAGQDLQKNSPKDTTLPPKAGGHPLLLYVLILTTGLFLGNLIFSLLKHQAAAHRLPSSQQNHKAVANGLAFTDHKHEQSSDKNAVATSQAINPPVPSGTLAATPQENKLLETNFVLNGIFVSADGSYALINNRIVRVNDYVNGAKVSSITDNTVELENTAGKITLSTSSR
jgi:hypothetical protein